jgi:hypothetical protein
MQLAARMHAADTGVGGVGFGVGGVGFGVESDGLDCGEPVGNIGWGKTTPALVTCVS